MTTLQRLISVVSIAVLASLAATSVSGQPAGPPPPNLTLKGTFVMEGRSLAVVVIPPDKIGRVYAPGDCLPRLGGYPLGYCGPEQSRLVRVEDGRIVVERGGKRYVVHLDRQGVEELEKSAPASASTGEPAKPPKAGARIRRVQKAFQGILKRKRAK